MFRKTFVYAASFLLFTLSSFLIAKGPGDKDSECEDAEVLASCAKKTPDHIATACKVVPIDEGPWCKEGFVWGVVTTSKVYHPPLTVKSVITSKTLEFSKEEKSFALSLSTQEPDFDSVPFDLKAITFVKHIGTMEDSPWFADSSFFTHLPGLCGLDIWASSWPFQNGLNVDRLTYLRVLIFGQEDRRIFSCLKHCQNLQCLGISGIELHDGVRSFPTEHFTSLVSLNKLQALDINLPFFCWTLEQWQGLETVLHNNKNLKEIKLRSRNEIRVDRGSFMHRGSMKGAPPSMRGLFAHPFVHVHLEGFYVRTLRSFDVTCLTHFTLRHCGVIEEGFKDTPTQLREVHFEDTVIPSSVLSMLPPERLSKRESSHKS